KQKADDAAAKLKAEDEKRQAEAASRQEAAKLKAENDLKIMREAEARRQAEIARRLEEKKKKQEEAKKKAEEKRLPDIPGMIGIPESRYFMGADADRHSVTVSPYYIDTREVTVEQYSECVKSTRCNAPAQTKEGCNWGNNDRNQHPINCIGWMEANNYCIWKGKRLPTEAEWELAAKGKTENPYPWGRTPATCSHAVITGADGAKGCGANSTQPAGSKPLDKSPYGVMDMAGNVSEFVNDWYSSSYPSAKKDPAGPLSGTFKVTRGGSWQSNAGSANITLRSFTPMSSWSTGIGFRCARNLR
ncbi:MAG: SUMF1/EgtB/PvdO family nonheme iron enzyme, partial [Elusimicrobiaceae bacterium]|nr:SUMF1/EgtB/PvdO family nonheme iron enzyme [Elusimicrobiaceae bacterium]